MTAKQRAAKHYLPLYQDALISAAGYAKICGYDDAAKILHKMSLEALTNPSRRDKIKTTSANQRKNKEVTTMTNIRLIDDAYLCGYAGAEYRLHTDDGRPSTYVIRDNWYEASAVDDDGNKYKIVWSVLPEFDVATNDDESEACDWDNPAEVIRIDDGAIVTDDIKIIW